MVKMIVLWMILNGRPQAMQAWEAGSHTAIPFVLTDAPVQACEFTALQLRAFGYTTWCAPSIAL